MFLFSQSYIFIFISSKFFLEISNIAAPGNFYVNYTNVHFRSQFSIPPLKLHYSLTTKFFYFVQLSLFSKHLENVWNYLALPKRVCSPPKTFWHPNTALRPPPLGWSRVLTPLIGCMGIFSCKPYSTYSVHKDIFVFLNTRIIWKKYFMTLTQYSLFLIYNFFSTHDDKLQLVAPSGKW